MGSGHVVFGLGTRAKSLRVEQQCLSEPSVTVMGLMHLLALWCGPSYKGGGMKDNANRASAWALLDGLVAAATEALEHRGKTTMNVLFFPDWCCTYPRPSPQARDNFTLDLPLAKDLIDITPWRLACEQRRSPYASDVWNGCNLGTKGDRAKVADLMHAFACFPRAGPMLAQWCFALGAALEDALAADVAGEPYSSTISFAHSHIKDCLANPHFLHQKLFCYRQSTRDAPSDRQHWSMPTDKGESGNMNLQHALVCWGDNTAAVAVPQVPRLAPTFFFRAI